ncbi:hypothetical protein [Burkholderia sp. MSMB1459WGS]|uniref:hypothetical protein n=1 Tax=Burkholderia sp. MSMB1459WGS TaxID=1637970 RepID=UPI0012E3B57F|nr:hypothetical protein [Burkholderia sp. MSMB1459WGS]
MQFAAFRHSHFVDFALLTFGASMLVRRHATALTVVGLLALDPYVQRLRCAASRRPHSIEVRIDGCSLHCSRIGVRRAAAGEGWRRLLVYGN